MNIQATLLADMYKQNHRVMYHPDVTQVNSNFTNRSGKYSTGNKLNGVVSVGLQGSIKKVILEAWGKFFESDKEEAVNYHGRIISAMTGSTYNTQHLADLHDLGYLPIEIKALPEGTIVPYGVPCFTITNTHEDFPWVVNKLETVFSAENWPIQTSATTAANYKLNFMKSKSITKELIPFLGHDFSYRGMMGTEAATISAFGHLCSFAGTDTTTAVPYAMNYYNADLDSELIGTSVAATEHSVMCSWQEEGEVEAIKYLMEAFPEGILSIVSDTWDFWKLVNEYLVELKDLILARPGKIVIRPDSGDPVDILCGNPTASTEEERKGLIECLWDIFGGTERDGFKYLNESIGAIYGDSITLARQEAIIEKLEAKGFAADVVLGIGSYTYQYVTRDTHGSAIKATSILKAGKQTAIFKEPKTDPGKNSAKGLLFVHNTNGPIEVIEDVTKAIYESEANMLQTVFKDGKFVMETSLSDIRQRIDQQLNQLV